MEIGIFDFYHLHLSKIINNETKCIFVSKIPPLNIKIGSNTIKQI